LIPGNHIKKLGDHIIYPVGAVEFLQEIAFKGNVMVFFDWGAYVLWKLYPNVHVSLDSRYEATYPEWLVQEISDLYSAKAGWENTLTKYPTDLVVVSKNLPLSKVMTKQNEWAKIYNDKIFELYARPGLAFPYVDRIDRTFRGTFP